MIQALRSFAARVAAFKTDLKEVTEAFFAIEEKDEALQKSLKVAATGFRRFIYFLLDYWLAGLSWGMVLGLRALGYDFLVLFLAMWGFDIVVAAAFLAWRHWTGNDLTLAEDYRRAVDVLALKSLRLAQLAKVVAILKATSWDGPESIIIFFERELKTPLRKTVTLLSLTALQAVLWTSICYLGYESVSELWEFIKGQF